TRRRSRARRCSCRTAARPAISRSSVRSPPASPPTSSHACSRSPRLRGPPDGRAIRDLGRALGATLRMLPDPVPLVVLIEQDLAKAFGGYATEWGRCPLPLVVLDEV